MGAPARAGAPGGRHAPRQRRGEPRDDDRKVTRYGIPFYFARRRRPPARPARGRRSAPEPAARDVAVTPPRATGRDARDPGAGRRPLPFLEHLQPGD